MERRMGTGRGGIAVPRPPNLPQHIHDSPIAAELREMHVVDPTVRVDSYACHSLKDIEDLHVGATVAVRGARATTSAYLLDELECRGLRQPHAAIRDWLHEPLREVRVERQLQEVRSGTSALLCHRERVASRGSQDSAVADPALPLPEKRGFGSTKEIEER